MRFLVSLLALAWALGNLFVAYLFLTLSVGEKAVHKGLPQQGALLFGGLVLGITGLLLVGQSFSLMRGKTATS